MNINKLENETKLQHHKRLVFGKLENKILSDRDYVELSEEVYGKRYSSDVARRMMYGSCYTLKLMEEEKINNVEDNNILKEINIAKREIYKERQKFRDEKNEYHAWLREQSRMEHFYERMDESVDRILSKKSREIPSVIKIKSDSPKIICGFADPHYGVDFDIRGFSNEIINKYNPQEFEKRMWNLRDELISFCNTNNTNLVSIVDLGDSIEGLLHISQLKSLRGNIVDDIMDYSDFMLDWLTELSKYMRIDFYTSEGNHSDLRLLTGKKGDFPHENLERIYSRTLQRGLKDNPNINIHKSLNGLNYFNVNGYKILTAHGNHEKNIKNSIKEYEDTYNIDIDYMMVGHLHCKNEIEVAKGKEVIQVRSIMGINEYSNIIKKTSLPGATMFTIHKGYGKKYVNEVKFHVNN